MKYRFFPSTFAATTLFLLCACSARPAILDHEVLARGNATSLPDPEDQRYEVIESRSELKALYDRLFAGHLPRPPLPDIDFSRSLVVFVAMAQQSTAGYRIDLKPPILRENTLVIRTIFHAPSGEGPLATVLTRPFVVMRVTRVPTLESVKFIDGTGKNLARISLK